MKRILSLLLAVIMLFTAFALTACGETPASTTENTASASTASSQGEKAETTQGGTASTQGSAQTSGTTAGDKATTAASSKSEATTKGTSSTASVDDGLDGLSKHPDYMDVNFGGKTFTFISQKWWTGGWDCYEICAEITGNDNLIDEAIDKRNKTIETLYNCKIVQEYAAEGKNAYEYVYEDVSLGRCHYQFCMQMYSYLYMNNFYNFYNLDVDLTHSWWNANFIESLTEKVDGKNHLYSISGPFNLITYDSSYGLLVNKKLYDQLYATGKIKTDCFQAVRDGTWTFDLFTEVASAATSDTNGDQTMTYAGGDIFGCTDDGNYYGMRSFYYGSGIKTLVRNDDGSFRSINTDDSDFSTVNNILDKLIAFYSSGNISILGEEDTVRCISSGQSLFNPQYLYRLHNKDDYVVYGVDYGDAKISILPFPKYSETQDNYYTFVCNRAYGLKVSKNIDNPDEISDFVELFGFHSAKIVYPAYIKCIKTQCLCDEEAGEMLEIIMNNLIFDFGTYIGSGFVAGGKMATMVATSKKNSLSRAIAQITSITATEIDQHVGDVRTYGQS